jgi:PAS domain S-box-containing protein
MQWVEVNDTLCRMLGSPAEELVGKTWECFVADDDPGSRTDQFDGVFTGEVPSATFDKKYRRMDGSLISVRISSMPVHNEDGSVDYFVVFIQDITSLERTRQELQASNERMTVTQEELLAARAALAEKCEKLLQEESRMRESEAKFQSLLESIGRGYPPGDAPREPVAVPEDAGIIHQSLISGIARDSNTDDPTDLLDRKFTLMDTITRHDTNNRLTVLRGYIELMKECTEDPALHSYLRRQERAVEAIQDITAFTRTYRDLGMKEPSWQDVAGAIRNSAGLLELKSVTIYMDLAGLFVLADPLFEKVFYNLIENALQYGKKITRIDISAREQDEGLVIIIEDDGAGLPDDQKERIFELGVGENTGYGLFLVREILSMTRFSIRESGPAGAGARFEIVIPHGSYRYEPQSTDQG